MEVPLVDEGAEHECVAVHQVIDEVAGQLVVTVPRGHELDQCWLVPHSVQVDQTRGLPENEAVLVEGVGALLWRRGGMRTVDVLVLGPPRPRGPQLLLVDLAGLRLPPVPHLLPMPLLELHAVLRLVPVPHLLPMLLDGLLAASRLVVGAFG